MFSEAKVTEIYCMADDFCKEFAKIQEKYMVDDKNRKHRNKPNRMSDAEIMAQPDERCGNHGHSDSVPFRRFSMFQPKSVIRKFCFLFARNILFLRQ